MLLFFVIRYFLYSDATALSAFVQLMLGYIGTYLLVNTFPIEKTVNVYINWQMIMLVCSIIGLIIYSITALPILATVVTSESSANTYKIVTYGFFNTKISDYSDMTFRRTAGWYDEPGSFAFVFSLLLMINIMYINSNRLKNILLYGGLVTMSAAHIALVVIYTFIFNISLKKLASVLLLTSLVFISYIYLPRTGVGGFIRGATFERVEDILNGTDGSRDYSQAQKAANDFYSSGASKETIQKKYPSATPETFYFHIAQYGIWGLFFYYLIVIVGLWRNRSKKNIIQILLIIALLIYQRPAFLYPLYITFFYILFYADLHKISLSNRLLMNRSL